MKPFHGTVYTFLQQHLHHPLHIMEAGACDGTDTIRLAKMFPNCTIHSFEPVQELYELTKAKTQQYENVNVLPYALASTAGKTTIHRARRHNGKPCGSSSLLIPGEGAVIYADQFAYGSIETVQTILLDDYVTESKINHVDFVWLDLEGYESVVLESSPKTLAITKFLFLETNHIENYFGVKKTSEIIEWLESAGFIPLVEFGKFSDITNWLFVSAEYSAWLHGVCDLVDHCKFSKGIPHE